jgi:aryl-alcohol dehydrogenase-like predicted oxidoreductase
LEVLTRAATELGVTRSEVVLAWLTGGSPAVTPVVGVSTPAQLEKALSGARLVLPAELRARLDEAW